ncbi:hypothetical protein SAMN06273572_101901 [Monaibacterium marinum]|uniref:Uncharacterized protein n=1 Tax=Pontivivens marinum TaxID=1690039 RepID=A0A2C9CP97_9RHOB|nr:DUF2161 family putative PD-(D/E)XK-type phosphodiesterase [Monaibacterium marinum]SOH93047.1 hypothetical protein SAMN06273572_101901 [Monaibacterium marinum]
MAESDLYHPIKTLLSAQGYTVKGEIGPCDIVAMRGDEPPVIVEMKTGLTMALLLQGVDRLAMSEAVYLAVPRLPGRSRKDATRIKGMLRRLGLGLIVVKNGVAEVRLDPGPYAPRANAKRQGRLLREFQLRRGDPEIGGQPAGAVMTAYRQGCLRLATHLAQHGVVKASVAGNAAEVEKAATILRANHYGWFERVERGFYGLTPAGHDALAADDSTADTSRHGRTASHAINDA